jgi:hypothetical protein
MLNKLRWIYTMQLNYNFHSRKKEINEAKEYHSVVRNLIGFAFMTFCYYLPFFLCA